MLDRFQDLLDKVQEENIVIEEPIEFLRNQDPTNMIQFMKKIKLLDSRLEEIKSGNKRTFQLAEKMKTITQVEESKLIAEEVDRIISNTRDIRRAIIKLFNEINENNNTLKRKNLNDEPEAIIQEYYLSSFMQQFKHIMIEAQEVEQLHKEIIQTKMKRQLRILKDNCSEEEIEEIAKDPELVEQELQKVLIPGHPKLQIAVIDIQEKFRSIVQLEKSVTELCKMFEDMGFLVNEQGNLLDNIYNNIKKANDYVHKGLDNCIRAKKAHESLKKKYWLFLMCVIVILIIIFVIVFKYMQGEILLNIDIPIFWEEKLYMAFIGCRGYFRLLKMNSEDT